MFGCKPASIGLRQDPESPTTPSSPYSRSSCFYVSSGSRAARRALRFPRQHEGRAPLFPGRKDEHARSGDAAVEEVETVVGVGDRLHREERPFEASLEHNLWKQTVAHKQARNLAS